MKIIKSIKRWWRKFTKKPRPLPPFCSDCGEEIPKSTGVKCGQCSSIVCTDCWRDYHQWIHGKSPGGIALTYKSNGKIIVRK